MIWNIMFIKRKNFISEISEKSEENFIAVKFDFCPGL